MATETQKPRKPRTKKTEVVKTIPETVTETTCCTCNQKSKKTTKAVAISGRDSLNEAILLLEKEIPESKDILDILCLLINEVIDLKYAENKVVYKDLIKTTMITIKKIKKGLKKLKFEIFSRN